MGNAGLMICCLVSVCFAYNPVVFDSFTAPTSMVALEGHSFVSRISRDTRIWQGERDLGLFLSSTSANVTCVVSNGAATIVSKSNNSSFATFQYDGRDDSMKFTNHSVSPQNLYDGDAKGFQLHIVVQEEASALIFVLLKEGSCSYQFPLFPSSPRNLIDFDYFNSNHHLCDFSQVMGVELNLLFNSSNICSMTMFGTFSDGDYAPSRVDDLLISSSYYESLTSSMTVPKIIRMASDCCYGSIIGGQRDYFVSITQVGTASSYLRSNITERRWSLSTGSNFQGTACLQYDGTDVSNNLVANGLNSLDFTNQGLRDSLLFQVVTNTSLVIECSVYVNEENSVLYARASQTISPYDITAIFPFHSFEPEIDFTRIGALEIRVHLTSQVSLDIWNISFVNEQNWMRAKP